MNSIHLHTARIIGVSVAMILLWSCFTFSTHNAAAFTVPFGGRTLVANYCSCSAGCWNLIIGPPRGGSYMYCPATTILYQNYSFFPQAWQLGTATGFMECMQISNGKCVSQGGGPLMLMDGTSLY